MCMNNTLSLSPLWLSGWNILLHSRSFRTPALYPFAILLFAVIAFIGLRTDTRSLFHAGCLLWGGAELFMFGAGSDSALVWFCDPSDVGWIFTIINFCSYWHPVLPVHYLPGVYGQSFRWLLEKTSVWYLYHCRSNPVPRYF